MTDQQHTTINQIYLKIKKWNPDVKLDVSKKSLRNREDIKKGHVDVEISQVNINGKYEAFGLFEVNTVGTITKGKWDYLNPVKSYQTETILHGKGK